MERTSKMFWRELCFHKQYTHIRKMRFNVWRGGVCLCGDYYQSKQMSKDVKYSVTTMIVNTFVKPGPNQLCTSTLALLCCVYEQTLSFSHLPNFQEYRVFHNDFPKIIDYCSRITTPSWVIIFGRLLRKALYYCMLVFFPFILSIWALLDWFPLLVIIHISLNILTRSPNFHFVDQSDFPCPVNFLSPDNVGIY